MVPTASYDSVPARLNHGNYDSVEARWGLRKLVVSQCEVLREGDSDLPHMIKQVTASAVVKNPWVSGGTESELIRSSQHIAARLAKLLTDRILTVIGGAAGVQAFGKGAIIGVDGELEHGAALTHTPYFAGHLRSFFEGTAVISFADTRGAAGESLIVPLCDKETGVRRDYYQSVRVCVPDAPLPDEIVLVAAAASGPRPFPRVGDRTTDLPLDITHMNGVFA